MPSAFETIRHRSSQRSYSGRALAPAEADLIRAAFVSSRPCPFGSEPRFALLESAQFAQQAGDGKGRIGTYGVIRNAPAWIVGAIVPGPYSFYDFGYAMEGIILAASAAGLGTCWLGGTFSRASAESALGLGSEELVPCATPVGQPAERRTLVDSVFRLGAGSASRKPWSELFFEGRPGIPLEIGNAGAWANALEAVRLAPSASNKQPWRMVRDAPGRFRLLLAEDALYKRALGAIRIQEIDVGIAMRHFESVAREAGLPGAWKRSERDTNLDSNPLVYVATWTAET